jgi:hypothetical protein
MSGVQANLLNLMRSANQAQEIGVSQTPNMASVPDKVLAAAGGNLLETTKTNKDLQEYSAAKCRSYTGIEGIRQLQKDAADRSYYDSGCGWIYKPSEGLNPVINRGALGSAQGPSLGKHGQEDNVSGGAKWYWDLKKAEKDISIGICNNVTKCEQLSRLGKYADICGFCKTTGAIIPVKKNAIGSGFVARYNDSIHGCKSADIVTAAKGTCAPKAEGFASLNDLDNCESPLSRDCVILSARMAGCSDKGTLIKALSQGGEGDYDKQLLNTPSFATYMTSASPGITKAVLKDGSASIDTALADFGNLMGNTQSSNKKLSAASRDLCLRQGEFDAYDFCSELSPSTVIDQTNISCAQKLWKQNGGTQASKEYPTVSNSIGKKFSDIVAKARAFNQDINTNEKNTNADGLLGLTGVKSGVTVNKRSLPRDTNTRGCETVWFDIGNFWAPSPKDPITVMKCELNLKKDGETAPYFNDYTEGPVKYNINMADSKAGSSMFEIRSDTQTSIRFWAGTDDGFMMGMNQNPFEARLSPFAAAEWGGWRYQGPTGYESREITIEKDSLDKPHVFVTKFFNGGGQSQLRLYVSENKQAHVTVGNTFNENKPIQNNVYLTQEPLAPWMQYELCTRPNSGRGAATGFFERRWNGQSAITPGGTPLPSFDVNSGSIVFQTDPNQRKDVPGKKGYMTLNSGSWWHTRAHFCFAAFKTITLLFRPQSNLADSTMVHVFSHINFLTGLNRGIVLTKNNGTYTLKTSTGLTCPVTVNEWNLLVVQYSGSPDAGIAQINFFCESLNNLFDKSKRTSFLTSMRQSQGATSPIIIGPTKDKKNAGMFALGGTCQDYKDMGSSWNGQSFSGDVAWLHGFRNYLDTDELLLTELQQNWLYRWPIPNIDGEKE